MKSIWDNNKCTLNTKQIENIEPKDKNKSKTKSLFELLYGQRRIYSGEFIPVFYYNKNSTKVDDNYIA